MANLLIDTYIFYADIYLLQNFLMKAAVLYLSIFSTKVFYNLHTLKGIGKLIFAAFLGTCTEIAGLMLGNSYQMFLLLVHLLEIPFMVRFVLGKECKHMLRVIITGYFFIIVVNGVLEILWNRFGKQGIYVILLCAACGIVYLGVRIWQNYNHMEKGILQVEILHDGNVLQAKGFYDSGNLLKDPYTGKGVHILSEKMLTGLIREGQEAVYIPYQSLGNEQGLIKVYYIEHIRIQKKQEIMEIQKIPVGAGGEELFQNKAYQMILNEDIW